MVAVVKYSIIAALALLLGTNFTVNKQCNTIGNRCSWSIGVQ